MEKEMIKVFAVLRDIIKRNDQLHRAASDAFFELDREEMAQRFSGEIATQYAMEFEWAKQVALKLWRYLDDREEFAWLL